MGTPILAHGAGHLFTYFPLLFVGAAIFFIVTALRDGSGKKSSTRPLPTSPLSRQVWMATRRQRRTAERVAAERAAVPSIERGLRPKRITSLQVMKGEAERPQGIPRRFEPPPSQRRGA